MNKPTKTLLFLIGLTLCGLLSLSGWIAMCVGIVMNRNDLTTQGAIMEMAGFIPFIIYMWSKGYYARR